MSEITGRQSAGEMPGGTKRPRFWIAAAVLGAVLASLFRQSLQPGQALFANDAPLGAMHAYAPWGASHFFGVWFNLNWVGSVAPSAPASVSAVLFLLLGGTYDVVIFNNLYAPLSLLFLGLAAWFLARQLRFPPAVCLLVGLAAALNSDPFSYACWGLPTLPLGMAATFLALGLIVGSNIDRRWPKLALAGFAVGLSVMETYDSGAILSLYVAAFAVWLALAEPGGAGRNFLKGAGRVGLVAVCAFLIATQVLESLVTTQVKGVVGMSQDVETKQRRWAEATQWSLPKKETLRLVIPGLFGYRMDTPDGGNYWGGVGRDLAWESYLSEPNPDPARAPHTGGIRHSGAGFHAGVLVVLVALWAIVQAFRRKGSAFEPSERRLVLFWAGAAVVSLLLSFGRHAPFYQFFYALPYFSTIRNPIKFLHALNLTLVILFGYGLHGMWRRYVLGAPTPTRLLAEHLKAWWRTLSRPDKPWVLGCVCAVLAAVVGWMLYAAARPDLVRHLRRAGFPEGPDTPGLAESMARFSVGEVGWFVVFLLASVAAVTLVLSGAWGGRRGKWAGLLLGLVVFVDLFRANTPWVVYYDYREKYASNPILDLLRQNPYERRVTSEVVPLTRQYMMHQVLYDEWLQRLFPYYRIQSLDIVQMPRTPELDAAYLANFRATNSTQLAKVGRLWQLTNTRFVLGPTQYGDAYNQQYDPSQRRFRVLTNFNVVSKPGVSRVSRVEQLTAEPDPAGQFAIFEFSAALPRARLFTRWQVNTNDQEVLARLVDPAFDPADTVLVSGELPAPAATAANASNDRVEFIGYEPKRVRLKTEGDAPAVLLLNDRWHPEWKVLVDGQPAPLLRCNFIMRGVHLAPGPHTVEFRFEPPVRSFYVSLVAVVIALTLGGVLVFGSRRATAPTAPAPSPEPEPRAPGKKPARAPGAGKPPASR